MVGIPLGIPDGEREERQEDWYSATGSDKLGAVRELLCHPNCGIQLKILAWLTCENLNLTPASSFLGRHHLEKGAIMISLTVKCIPAF